MGDNDICEHGFFRWSCGRCRGDYLKQLGADSPTRYVFRYEVAVEAASEQEARLELAKQVEDGELEIWASDFVLVR